MSKLAICSPFADNDGRPSWMYDDDGPGCNTSNGAYEQALKSNLDEVAATDATATGVGVSPAVDEIAVPVYENIELERNKGKAAEIYRLMKKR
jgi:hypothetical protein